MNCPSFLIIKLSALGDVIQSLGVSSYLKEKFPKSHITWVVESKFSALVKAYPDVDQVLDIDTKKVRKAPLKSLSQCKGFIKKLRSKKYDVCFDLQGNTKSCFFLMFLKKCVKVGFSKTCVPEWTNLFFTNHKIHIDQKQPITLGYLSLARKYFSDHASTLNEQTHLIVEDNSKSDIDEFLSNQNLKNKPLIMVCPGSNWESKRLTEDVLSKFLKQIDGRFDASFIFIWGSPKEKEQANRLELVFSKNSKAIGALEFSTWYYLISKVDVMIAMDSASLHLAALAKVPTFSVFGPSNPSIYKPVGALHTAFKGTCPYKQTFTKRCPKLRTCKTPGCMLNIDAQLLYDSFVEFFENYLAKTNGANEFVKVNV